jgi:hypothetical protein
MYGKKSYRQNHVVADAYRDQLVSDLLRNEMI